MIHSTS